MRRKQANMKFKHILLLTFVLSTFSIFAQNNTNGFIIDKKSPLNVTRVACIGNSVTYGAGIENREANSYPAQLQNMLKDNYLVGNFGKNGATLLKKGHNPYYKTEEFKQVIDFKADIAIVHLGLNDTDPRNWPNFRDDFEKDYSWLIDTLLASNSEMKIYVAKMSPIFSGHPRFLSSTFDWYWQIQNTIERIANANQVELVDFHQPLYFRPDLLPDNLHPNASGATLLAKEIYTTIKGYSDGFKLNDLFQSQMVIQRNKPIRIHGKANTGSEVFINITNSDTKTVQSQTTKANQKGNWEVTFQEMHAGGPYTITINNDSKAYQLSDVLLGDVWLASGQSNMYFPLSASENAKEEIQNFSSNPNIRYLKFKPLAETNDVKWEDEVLNKINDLNYFYGHWKKSSEESASEFSAIAYYFARNVQFEENIPIGIIELAVGGSPLISWIDRKRIESNPLLANTLTNWITSDYIQDWCRARASKNIQNTDNPKQRHPYEPAYNFEAGISKLTNLSISGLIWYQGESDANNAELYEKEFPIFVKSWREQWQDEFPIYHVQLSSIDRPSWPYFRETQRKLSEQIEGLYMAVSSDLGDKKDVHPKKKEEIGIRLANLALKHTYNLEKGNVHGPLPIHAEQKNKQVVISFQYGEGLKTSDGQPLRGFRLKTGKGDFISPSSITIHKNKILLKTPSTIEIDEIKEVFYAWEGYTDANLINSARLPASTFNIKIQ